MAACRSPRTAVINLHRYQLGHIIFHMLCGDPGQAANRLAPEKKISNLSLSPAAVERDPSGAPGRYRDSSRPAAALKQKDFAILIRRASCPIAILFCPCHHNGLLY